MPLLSGHYPLAISLIGTLCSVRPVAGAQSSPAPSQIGREVSIAAHLKDGEELDLPMRELVAFGGRLFSANWTIQEGQGRPQLKGTGKPLSDPTAPLIFPRNVNRLSGPDANSCAGCHNVPVPGGAGDIVGNVFVLGQRFDFISFAQSDAITTKGTLDERGAVADLMTFANSRATPGLFGAGYYELLAREITADLRAIAAGLQPGQTALLQSKGISFGLLARRSDGSWDASRVTGLPPEATASSGAAAPTLILQPWHQAGAVVSLRQFTNNAFLQHHGIEPEERVGLNVDLDGDGFRNELTVADVTAAVIFQASMAVPGRMIPNDPAAQKAVLNGEAVFHAIGCADCHIQSLPLRNWVFTEPSPFNPSGNLQIGQAPTYGIDLTAAGLPSPRLRARNGVINVPVYSDFRLHDMCDASTDPNNEPLNQNQSPGSPEFFSGNCLFLTRRLWDVGSKPNHYHHGKFTTLRESVMAHSGEGSPSRTRFMSAVPYDQDSVIEFLKSLKVLPAGTRSLAITDDGTPIVWPPK